ncbi:MAG TPA: hypothetical protein VKB46_06045 [Pyrinomonadaceae bacterium]|nr:hypothetical protein [Pyrinomonadaceae bacterium]
MTRQVVTTLPNGYWEGGAFWREAHLRELTGSDHVFLIEECNALLPAHWATELLTRCVTRLGPKEATRDSVRSLTVGDREALLLHLRRLTLGDRLACVISCPECHEKLDLDIDVGDMLQPPKLAAVQEHELTVEPENGEATVVRFRLPEGIDQEEVATVALTDIQAAADLLLRRCVLSVTSNGELTAELPDSLGERLAARMSELDSQAEINVLASCEACGVSFNFVFDAASFLFQELKAEFQGLYREIHLLAFHYHWSPADILNLSTRERRRFLKLLDRELNRELVQ